MMGHTARRRVVTHHILSGDKARRRDGNSPKTSLQNSARHSLDALRMRAALTQLRALSGGADSPLKRRPKELSARWEAPGSPVKSGLISEPHRLDQLLHLLNASLDAAWSGSALQNVRNTNEHPQPANPCLQALCCAFWEQSCYSTILPRTHLVLLAPAGPRQTPRRRRPFGSSPPSSLLQGHPASLGGIANAPTWEPLAAPNEH